MGFKTVISGLARTPMGGMQGMFSTLSASKLGTYAVKGALQRSGVSVEKIDEIIMGCVFPALGGDKRLRIRPQWELIYQLVFQLQLLIKCVVP